MEFRRLEKTKKRFLKKESNDDEYINMVVRLEVRLWNIKKKKKKRS